MLHLFVAEGVEGGGCVCVCVKYGTAFRMAA